MPDLTPQRRTLLILTPGREEKSDTLLSDLSAAAWRKQKRIQVSCQRRTPTVHDHQTDETEWRWSDACPRLRCQLALTGVLLQMAVVFYQSSRCCYASGFQRTQWEQSECRAEPLLEPNTTTLRSCPYYRDHGLCLYKPARALHPTKHQPLPAPMLIYFLRQSQEVFTCKYIQVSGSRKLFLHLFPFFLVIQFIAIKSKIN